jgi:hypothetical protein
MIVTNILQITGNVMKFVLSSELQIFSVEIDLRVQFKSPLQGEI